jgi:hypothetical protein
MIMEQVHKAVVHIAIPYYHQSRHGRCGSVSHCLKFAALRGLQQARSTEWFFYYIITASERT